jgi:hypothetical protein
MGENKNAHIGRIGVGIAMVRAESKGIKFIEFPGYHDRGIDAMLEYTDKENQSSILMVQCKAKNDLIFDKSKNEFAFYFDQSHYEYWTKYPIQAIITYVDVQSTSCYWSHFSKDNIEKTEKKYKITVKKTNEFPNDELFKMLSKKIDGEIDVISSKDNLMSVEYNKIDQEIEQFDYYIKEISLQLRKFDPYVHYLFYDCFSRKKKTFFKIYLIDYKKQCKYAKEKSYVNDYELNLEHSAIKSLYESLNKFYDFIDGNLAEESKLWLQEKYPDLHFEASEDRFRSKEFWTNFFGARFAPIIE